VRLPHAPSIPPQALLAQSQLPYIH
jgi:hypothetical protein